MMKRIVLQGHREPTPSKSGSNLLVWFQLANVLVATSCRDSNPALSINPFDIDLQLFQILVAFQAFQPGLRIFLENLITSIDVGVIGKSQGTNPITSFEIFIDGSITSQSVPHPSSQPLSPNYPAAGSLSPNKSEVVAIYSHHLFCNCSC